MAESNNEKLWGLLLPFIVSVACSLATTSYFTGKYVQQVLSNTDRIIVLERREDSMQNLIYTIKEDLTVNRTNLQWIKEELKHEFSENNVPKRH